MMKKKILNLQLANNKVRQVKALYLGNLAIHHGLNRKDFFITYVPTSTVLCSCRLRRTAKKIVVTLQKQIHYVGTLVDYAVSLEKGSPGARSKLRWLLEDFGADVLGETNYKD